MNREVQHQKTRYIPSTILHKETYTRYQPQDKRYQPQDKRYRIQVKRYRIQYISYSSVFHPFLVEDPFEIFKMFADHR